MKDPIERQEAIDAVSRGCQEFRGIFAECEKNLNELPPAHPEIVRCKDCIKREICRTSTTWAVAPKDDWYCADAERRTDG